jgi:hypothetical protein
MKINLASLQATLFVAAALAASSLLSRQEKRMIFRDRGPNRKSRADDLFALRELALNCIVAEIES